MELRRVLAHAATPWSWRSRRSVQALVAATVLIAAVGTARVLATDSGRTTPIIQLALSAVIWLLIGVRPAIRSLRRWDAEHPRLEHSTRPTP